MELSEILDLTTEELESLAHGINAELAKRKSNAEQRVTVTFDSYNDRRYGKPWIARVVSWPIGKAPELQFGRYLGNCTGGDCEIMARPGDVIRYGQKDLRGGNTLNVWAMITDSYTVIDVSERNAREQYTEGK